jgi:hypothetical protein
MSLKSCSFFFFNLDLALEYFDHRAWFLDRPPALHPAHQRIGHRTCVRCRLVDLSCVHCYIYRLSIIQYIKSLYSHDSKDFKVKIRGPAFQFQFLIPKPGSPFKTSAKARLHRCQFSPSTWRLRLRDGYGLFLRRKIPGRWDIKVGKPISETQIIHTWLELVGICGLKAEFTGLISVCTGLYSTIVHYFKQTYLIGYGWINI